MRKVAWRLMIRVTPREVARFIQLRFEELRCLRLGTRISSQKQMSTTRSTWSRSLGFSDLLTALSYYYILVYSSG